MAYRDMKYFLLIHASQKKKIIFNFRSGDYTEKDTLIISMSPNLFM